MSNKSTIFAAIILTFCCGIEVFAQQRSPSAATSYDCTNIELADVDDLLLTRQERIAAMDGSLKSSLDAHSSCMTKAQNARAAAGGSGSSVVGSTSANNSAAVAGAQTKKQQSMPVSSGGSIKTQVNRKLSAPKDNNSIICKLLWEEIQTARADKRAGFEKQYADYKCG